MSDEYEAFVTAWRDYNGLFGYEIPHLCDLLRAYDAERAKETCEWTWVEEYWIDGVQYPAYWKSCKRKHPCRTEFCGDCGRRIEEVKG